MTFRTWFRKQYGPRPSGRKTTKQLWEEMLTSYVAYTNAKAAFHEREKYEDQEDAALKAWQVKEARP